MLTKDRGHERADELMFITRAANADRLPYSYGRSMNYSVADIISVIRNEHDEDQHQRSIFSDLHLRDFQQSRLIRNWTWHCECISALVLLMNYLFKISEKSQIIEQ